MTIRRLTGGGRFVVTVDGDPPLVTKRGDPAALAREARALRLTAGTGLTPQLVDAARGVLVTEYLDGEPRDLATLDARAARALGTALRRLHDVRHTASARLPGWSSPVRSLAGYRRRRARDTVAAAQRTPYENLALDVVSGLPAFSADAEPAPFRVLHGDLVAANIVWTPEPRFVDLEFWRMGDPAEDLAYLVGVGDVPEVVQDEIAAGLGDRGGPEGLSAWRRLATLDAGLWFLANGDEQRARTLLARVQ